MDSKPTRFFRMYTYFALIVLTCIYAMNIGNRFLLSTLTEPIKTEFGISDGTFGLLAGAISAFFLVVAGIPFGILADRGNRKRIIITCTSLFSVMTALGGMAHNIYLLSASRIGVGIGAGGTTPSSLSFISDIFPTARHATVMTIFTLGISIGGYAASAGVGWLSDHYGWRFAMTAAGLAGLPFVLLFWMFAKEPKRGVINQEKVMPATFTETIKFIWQNKALLHVMIGAMVITMWTWGLILWIPPFLSRSHGLTTGGAGAALGNIHLIGGVAAITLTIVVMRYFEKKKDKAAPAKVIAVTAVLGTFATILAFQTSSLTFATYMLWLYIPIGYLYTGPVFGLCSALSKPGMRGQVIAISSLTQTLADLVVIPPLLGFASDILATQISDPAQSLRYALLIFSVTGFWGAFHFFMAARVINRSGKQIAGDSSEPATA